MATLTNRLFSFFVVALLLVPVLALAADAIPDGYVRNYGKSFAAKKTVAGKSGRRATARMASSSNKHHANYQRRVASYNGIRRNAGGDYLSQVGGNSRWSRGKTIRVFVAPGKASYKNMVADAMNQWSRASGGKLSWTLTGNADSADYTIGWTAKQRQVAAGTEAGLTTTDTMVDPYTGRETIDHARTHILTRLNGRQLKDSEIAETILHEIGHALGFEGHSSNPTDIMYYAATTSQGGLTARDMNTISRLYSR